MQTQELIQTPPRERVVFLNALPLNAFDMESFTLNVAKAELEELRKFSRHGNIVSYIRHPATISLLRRYVANLPAEPASGLYRYSAGDVLVVVTLKSPQRGAEAQQVSEQDVVVHVVTVL